MYLVVRALEHIALRDACEIRQAIRELSMFFTPLPAKQYEFTFAKSRSDGRNRKAADSVNRVDFFPGLSRGDSMVLFASLWIFYEKFRRGERSPLFRIRTRAKPR